MADIVYKWTDPKTNWSSSDKFNLSDYYRIANNIRYIHWYAKKYYDETLHQFSITDLHEMKDYTIESIPRYEISDTIVVNILQLHEQTFAKLGLTIEEMNRYTDDSKGWTYTDLNIIERNIELLYGRLVGSYKELMKLPFIQVGVGSSL